MHWYSYSRQVHFDLGVEPATVRTSKPAVICIYGLGPLGLAVFSRLLKAGNVRKIILVGESATEPTSKEHLESDFFGILSKSDLWRPAADVLQGTVGQHP